MSNLPLSLLLQKWEQEVRPVEPSTQILIQEVLYTFGKEWMMNGDLDEIRKAIGPILARNEEEQIKFKEIFEEDFIPYVKSSSTLVEGIIQKPLKREKDRIEQAANKSRVWVYLALALLLFAFNRGLFRTEIPYSDKIEKSKTEKFPELEDSKLDPDNPGINGSLIDLQRFLDSNKGSNVLANLEEIDPSDFDIKLTINPSYAPLDIRRKVNISSTASPNDNFQIHLSTKGFKNNPFSELGTGDSRTKSSFVTKKEGNFTHAGVYAFEIETNLFNKQGTQRLLSYKHDKILFVPAFNPGTQEYRDFQLGIINHQQDWMKIRIFILLILLLVFAEGGLNLWKSRRRKLAFRMEFDSSQDGRYELPFDEIEKRLRVDPNIADLAVQLNLRRKSHIQSLDVDGTIKETIASAGMPKLIYENQFKAPEYIALMEDDGKMPFYKEFIRQLQKQDVPISCYTYDIEAGLVFDAKHPEGIRLPKLNYIHPHSQLIILSDGHRLLDSVSLEIKEYLKEELDLWEDRLLITPVLPELWSGFEQALAEQFQLVPTYIPDSAGKWEIDRSPAMIQKREGTGYDFSRPEEVKAYLGEELFAWLSASMVHNKPKYEVLLAVGHAISAKQEEFVSSGNFVLDLPKQDFVNLTNLAKIYSLPWMKEGNVPSGMKKAMLEQLPPETEALARKAVIEELENTHPAVGSPAMAERNKQLAIQRSKLHPNDKLLQRKLRYLWMEDKLEVEEKEQVKVGNSLQKLQMIFPLRQSLLALAFGGFLAMMGYNFYQSQPEPLVRKYILEDESTNVDVFASYPNEGKANEGESHPVYELASVRQYLKSGEINNMGMAEVHSKELKEKLRPYAMRNNPELLLLADWYRALTLVGSGEIEQGKVILSQLINSGNHYFQQRAFLLLWDLEKPWYQNSLPVKKYLKYGQPDA
ncbi:MAG: hypothetical protein MRZ79_12045 [Bacteroidia bacterium]|nr:hypothetical protein [Bacteroidia bacterium]